LAQQIEQFQPFRAGERLPDAGQLTIRGFFEGALLSRLASGLQHLSIIQFND
jgi:hypothetical protein